MMHRPLSSAAVDEEPTCYSRPVFHVLPELSHRRGGSIYHDNSNRGHESAWSGLKYSSQQFPPATSENPFILAMGPA